MSTIVQRKRPNQEETNRSNSSIEEEEDLSYGLTLMEEIILLGLKDSEVYLE
jgi:hypothetical protein